MNKLKLINIKRPKILFKKNIYNCQLGLKGKLPVYKKKEGDFATPIGKWKLGKVFLRRDKLPFLKIKKNIRKRIIYISKNSGWCDDTASRTYNKYFKIKKSNMRMQIGHERLFRSDDVYDVIIEVNYNINPTIKGKGSAIFIHCSFKDLRSTKGCVAMYKNDLIFLLKILKNDTILQIC
tara:strand:+ start:352 stop:888 length:537 start_codon:yes stop_codon:yes gene_type:complete